MARIRKECTDGRMFNGGPRANAGRLSKLGREHSLDQLLKTVIVNEYRHGQIRRVKKTYLDLILDFLFEKAMKENHIPSARLYLDLALGKPVGSYRVTTSVPLLDKPNPKLVKRLARYAPELIDYDIYLDIEKVLPKRS